jgi:hypothetical protein
MIKQFELKGYYRHPGRQKIKSFVIANIIDDGNIFLTAPFTIPSPIRNKETIKSPIFFRFFEWGNELKKFHIEDLNMLNVIINYINSL